MELKLANSDARRDLYELPIDGWKVIKLIEAKQTAEVGNHYHKNKDEFFVNVGTTHMNYILNGGDLRVLYPFQSIHVPRGTFHVFYVNPGSKLLCLASELHDPSDDHK